MRLDARQVGNLTQKVDVNVRKGRNTNQDPLEVLPGEMIIIYLVLHGL